MTLLKRLLSLSFLGIFLCSFTDTNIDELSNGTYKVSLGSRSLIASKEQTDNFLSYANWFFEEYNTKLPLAKYNIYKYSRYIDLPVSILFERTIRAQEEENFEISISNSKTTTYGTIHSETNTTFESVKHSISLSSSRSSCLNLFDLLTFSNDYGTSSTTSIELSKSFSETYTNSFEKQFNFTLSYKQDVNVDNPYNFQINYRLCYRQKFQVYLFEYFEYKYKQVEHLNGIHGTTYTYEIDDDDSSDKISFDSGTYFILIPTSDNTYLDESFYANNKYGELFNIETRIENNVLYL